MMTTESSSVRASSECCILWDGIDSMPRNSALHLTINAKSTKVEKPWSKGDRESEGFETLGGRMKLERAPELNSLIVSAHSRHPTKNQGCHCMRGESHAPVLLRNSENTLLDIGKERGLPLSVGAQSSHLWSHNVTITSTVCGGAGGGCMAYPPSYMKD